MNKKKCILEGLILAALLGILLGVLLFREQKKNTENTWTVTSYPMNVDVQGMCYAIEDQEGHFVLVDGGWDDCSWQVLQLVASHGSHVDAWILTHPHQDHISAFLNLYEHEYDFTVDRIYAIDLNAEHYAAVVEQFDGGYEFFDRFQKIAEHLDNIQAQTATAREFLLLVRTRNMKEKELFAHLNRVEKIVLENGFTVARFDKDGIKTLLAVYFEQNTTNEKFEDIDGERWLINE